MTTDQHDSVKAGVTESWDFWLSQHDVSVPETIQDAVKEAFTGWLDAHSEAITQSVVATHSTSIVEAVDVLFQHRHNLTPDVLRSLQDIYVCACAARYGEDYESGWLDEADFANHDVSECEAGSDAEVAAEVAELEQELHEEAAEYQVAPHNQVADNR